MNTTILLFVSATELIVEINDCFPTWAVIVYLVYVSRTLILSLRNLIFSLDHVFFMYKFNALGKEYCKSHEKILNQTVLHGWSIKFWTVFDKFKAWEPDPTNVCVPDLPEKLPHLEVYE